MPRIDADTVVIGAGLAGLRCAQLLTQAGRRVRLIEAADKPGGRVRTDTVAGYRLDRGFQVFLSNYQEAARCLDISKLRLCNFVPGALIYVGGRFRQFADPLRMPLATLATTFSGVGTWPDLLRLLKLRLSVQPPAQHESPEDEVSTAEYLVQLGFSQRIIDRFFRPFYGGVLQDANLSASRRIFDFTFHRFATGYACVPASGMEQIPNQLAAQLPPGTLSLGTQVLSITLSGAQCYTLQLSNAQTLTAHEVVVAVEQPTAARLLADVAGVTPLPDIGEVGVSCLWFRAPRPVVGRNVLVLNGEGNDNGPVNNLAEMTSVSPDYGPADGSALIAASVLNGARRGDGDRELEARVRKQLSEWYGEKNVAEWTLLRCDTIRHGQPRQATLIPWDRTRMLRTGLVLAGDHCTQASIDGALVSGRRAAELVLNRA